MMRFALLSTLLVAAIAQQSGKDPTKDVCRRHKHQTCIIDSKLYVDGGLAYYGGSKGNDSVAERNTYLLWEDVSNATRTEYSFPDQHANLSKGRDVPSVSGGVLWPDTVNKLFYLFGGEYNDTEEVQSRDGPTQGFSLWYYDTIYDAWNKTKGHGSQSSIRWPAFGSGTVSDAGIAYYYGGYLTNTSDFKTVGQPVMQNTLISYDMDSRQWDSHIWDDTRRAEGSLQYIPASEGGMLVYFGGVETDKTSGGLSYANMSQIHVYDVANPRWYTQTATGDIPRPRRGFCAGVVWAKDKSSYNIYLFGGFGGPDGTGLGDLYVLSIPSFQWILIWPTPQQTIFPGGKGWSSCDIVRDSQMIIIGGALTNTSVPDCDAPKIGGQHGLLLGQENVELESWWHAPMDNTTGYRVPDQIVARIGGGADGTATAKEPDVGWVTQDLAKYFATTYPGQSRTAMRPIPTVTSQPTSSPPPPAKKTNTGAIAGGTVGGVIALLSVIALVFFCLRSRRRRKAAGEQSQLPEATGGPNPHTPDMARKSVANSSVLQGSTLHSPMPQSPAYSPQNSPPPALNAWHGDAHAPNTYHQNSPSPHLNHHSGDWGPQGSQAQNSYAYQQPYYPPPPEPSQSPKESNPHTMSVELPDVRSPANAEMAQMRNPLPGRYV
ncbi:uncharacterized protein EKO05_0011196 [Ascochyta rabiei]|uniref:Uncharacterized protein n=1 Tax=Didymella rabiei TaxID=5454 RepID=A0A163D8A6_DIDRA|nr:uncharacterized protein EKO05_0011196 [Ascochyta rabiei]KZM22983.1 hypothetical protein ST47_g5883 [Ascochyta rabiei]UPX20990.1 hypothetical protein EKO05_0011196 [Ascochyta rabiei]